MTQAPISPAPMMNDPDAATTPRQRMLRFRAWRRGTREADLILGPFADREVILMTPQEADAFEALLDQPDPMLYAWIIGREPVPPEFDHAVFRRIKAFLPTAHLHIASGA